MESVRKHKDIKLVTTEGRRIYLISEANHHTTQFFTESLLTIEMRKTQILVIPPYLSLSILEMLSCVIWIQTASLSTKNRMYL